MRIIFLMILSIFILVSCGKKADPQYQGNNNSEDHKKATEVYLAPLSILINKKFIENHKC